MATVDRGRSASRDAQAARQPARAADMEAVARFVGRVAHDVNNALTTIMVYSDALWEHLPPDDPHRRLAAEIRGAADQAESLARQLLAFSRNQALDENDAPADGADRRAPSAPLSRGSGPQAPSVDVAQT